MTNCCHLGADLGKKMSSFSTILYDFLWLLDLGFFFIKGARSGNAFFIFADWWRCTELGNGFLRTCENRFVLFFQEDIVVDQMFLQKQKQTHCVPQIQQGIHDCYCT